MKKFLTVTLCVATLCALAGCGSSKSASEATTATEADSAADIVYVEMDASEYVELGDYKNLTVTVDQVEVTDEDVQEYMDMMAEDYAEYKEITDRDTVKDGDYVNIDYDCIIDGEKNDVYSETNLDAHIGEGELNSYVGFDLEDGFDLENKILGAKKGDTVVQEFTFPEDYDDDEVAGKKCTMNVKINAIEKEVIPEITDEFVKENDLGYESAKEYREATRKELEESAESDAMQLAQEDAMDQIIAGSKQKKEFTEEMIEQEKNNLLLGNEEYASYFGMTAEEYIEESYGKSLEESAQYSLKQQCVFDLLLEAENIEITDKEYEEGRENIAAEMGLESGEELEEYYSEDSIRSEMMYTKLIDRIMSYTTVKKNMVSSESVEE